MDNLINETNIKLQDIINNLETIKNEYESKLNRNSHEIEHELKKVDKYKNDFYASKDKIDKMNADIEGFEIDYQKLVDRFKDDELANILVAANKEISSKIEERKRKIVKDKMTMNSLVEKAGRCKNKLVKLIAEKKALEMCLDKILDVHEYYIKSLTPIIDYSIENSERLCPKEETYEEVEENIENVSEEETTENEIDEEIVDEEINDNKDSIEEFNISLNQILRDLEDSELNIEEDKNNNEDDEVEEDDIILEDSIDEDLIDYKNENKENEVDFSDNYDISEYVNFDDTLEDDESLYEDNEETEESEEEDE